MVINMGSDQLNPLSGRCRPLDSRLRLPRGQCAPRPTSVFGRTGTTTLVKMAEAATAVPQHRFYCHCCKGEIDPKLPVSSLTVFDCSHECAVVVAAVHPL